MARVYKDTRSGRYGIDYTEPSGRRRRKVVGTKSQAQKALARVVTQILDGEYKGAGRARRVTLQQVVDLWFSERAGKRSIETDRNNLGRVVSMLGADFRVAGLERSTIRDLRRRMEEEGLQPATRNRHVSTLRAACNLAVRHGLISANPLTFVEAESEPPAPDRVLTEAEEEALLRVAHPRDRLLVVLALESGARRGELAAARWSEIDLEHREWRIPVTKNGEPRMVPLTPRAVAELERWRSQPEVVLHRDLKRVRLDGHPQVFCGVRSSSLSSAFAALVKRAGIDPIRLHDLRHTCATRLRRRGVHAVTIAAVLGHKSWQMVQRYQHVTAADLKAAVIPLGPS